MPAMSDPQQDSGPSTDPHASTPAPPDRTVARPRRSWDAYIAILATLIGFLALLVAGYTAHVQRQQLRAQVWPYLSIATGNVAPHVGLHVVNSGTGPARVTAVRVTVDQHPVKTWAGAQVALAGQPVGLVQSQLGHTVLPADKELTMVRPYSDDMTASFVASFLGDKHDITISVCYCSVLDECWLVTTETVPQAIDDAGACPIAAAEQFKQ
jgi:hypothetical protein